MKSSVYQVVGCAGSQHAKEVNNCLSSAEAKKEATKRNRQNADGLGISYREYFKNEVSRMREGTYFSGRSGQDGDSMQ